MNDNSSRRSDQALRNELTQLMKEHRKLDQSIVDLSTNENIDHLMLQRMKKKKLALKDRIAGLEDQIFPDIIA